MRVAVLDAQGVITRIEDISEKGLEEGYRPDGDWVEAADTWDAGGVMDNGVYVPPATPVSEPSEVENLRAEVDKLKSVLVEKAIVTDAEIKPLRTKQAANVRHAGP